MATTATPPPSRAPPPAPSTNRSANLASAIERENASREPQQSFRPSSTWSATTGNHEVIWNGQDSIPPPLPNKSQALMTGGGGYDKQGTMNNLNGDNETELEEDRFSDAASWEGPGQGAVASEIPTYPQPNSNQKNPSKKSYAEENSIRQSTYGHVRNSSVGSSIWAGKGVSNNNSFSNNKGQKDGEFQFPPPLPTMPKAHSNNNLNTADPNYHLSSPMLSPGIESDYSSYDDDRRNQEDEEEERYSNPNGNDLDWMGGNGPVGLERSNRNQNGALEGSTPEIHSIENFHDDNIGEDGFEMISNQQSNFSPRGTPGSKEKSLEADERNDTFDQDLPSSSTITTDSNGKRFMSDGTPIPNLPPIPGGGTNNSTSPSMPSRSGSSSSSGGQRRNNKGRRNRSPILSYADGAEAEEALLAQQQAAERERNQLAMSNGISLDEDETMDEEGRRGPRLKKNSPAPWELDGDSGNNNDSLTSPTSPGFGLEKKSRSTSSNSNDNSLMNFPSSGSGTGVGAKFRGAAAKIDSGRRSTDSSRGTFSFGRDREKIKEPSNLSSHNYQSSNSIDDFVGGQRSSTSTDHQMSSGTTTGGGSNSGSSGKTSIFSNARARSKSVSGGMLKGLGLGGGGSSNNPPPLPPDVIAINPNPPSSSAASIHSSSGKKSKLAKAFRRNDDDHHGSKKNISLAAGISSADYFPANDENEKSSDSKDNNKPSNVSNFNSNLVNPFGPSSSSSQQQQTSAQSHPPSPYSFSSATSDNNLPPTSPRSATSNLPPPVNSQPNQSLSLSPMIGNPSSASSHSSAGVNSQQQSPNLVRSSSPKPTNDQGGNRISGTSSAEGVAAIAAGAGSSTAHSERNHVERELLLTGGKYISPTRSRFGTGGSPNPNSSSPLHSPSPSSPIGSNNGGNSIFANQQQQQQQQRSASGGASRTGSNVSYKRSSTFFDDRNTPPVRQASTNSTSNSQNSNDSAHLPQSANATSTTNNSNQIPRSPSATHPSIGENQSISSLQGDGFGGYVSPHSPQPVQNQNLPSSTSISSTTGGGGTLPPNLGISNSGSFPRPGEGAPYKLISLEQARQNQLRQQQLAQQQALAAAKERKEKARLEKLNQNHSSSSSNHHQNQPSPNPEDSTTPTRPGLPHQNSSDTMVNSGKQLKNKKSGFLRMFNNKEKDQISNENQPPMPRNDASLDESADHVSSMPTFSSTNNNRSMNNGNVPSIETDTASSSGHGHLGGKMEVPALKSLRPMSSMFSGFGADLLDPSSLAETSSSTSSGLLAPTSPALTTRSFESGGSGLYEDATGSGLGSSPQMTTTNLNVNPSTTTSSSISSPNVIQKNHQLNNPPRSISTPSYSTNLPGPVPPMSASSLGSEFNNTYHSPKIGRNPSLDNGSRTSISEGHSNFASPLTSPVPLNASNDNNDSQSFAVQQQSKLKERSGEPKERLKRLAKKEISANNNVDGEENRISTASSNHSEGSSLGLVNGFPATPSLSPNAPPSPAWRNRVIEIEAQILELTSELIKMRQEYQPDSKINLQNEISNSNSGEGEETLVDTNQQSSSSLQASSSIPPCNACGCTCADQRRQQAINEAAILKGVSILDRGRAIKRPADGSVGKFGGYLNR